MVLWGLAGFWVVMLDRGVYLATVQAVWVVLGGLAGCWVVMLDRGVYLASV